MEWFERWFGEDYLLVYEHRSTEQAEAESSAIIDILHLDPGEIVLDLCCGPGRHDRPLVERGCHVYGLDYSMTLLRCACDACDGFPTENGYPRYIRGDARKLPFRDGSFDAVLNLFTSFGYFSDEENAGMIRSVGRILKPGGRFFIDYFNTPQVIATLVPESMKEKNGMTIREVRTINDATRRVEKTIHLVDGDREEQFHESVRLYSEPEMRGLIADAGLTLDGVAGSVALEPYHETSPRMIFHGRKQA